MFLLPLLSDILGVFKRELCLSLVNIQCLQTIFDQFIKPSLKNNHKFCLEDVLPWSSLQLLKGWTGSFKGDTENNVQNKKLWNDSWKINVGWKNFIFMSHEFLLGHYNSSPDKHAKITKKSSRDF